MNNRIATDSVIEHLMTGKITIITYVNHWRKHSMKQDDSFLTEYPVEVVYNRIDTKVFKPTPSNFRYDYGISDDDIMILGVANKWEKRKGLGDFLELDRRLNTEGVTKEHPASGSRYRIVLVGLSPEQIKLISTSNPNIITISHTENATELAQIYTAADVFVDPTKEDNLPTVKLEAEACGTPVITYDTGGYTETIRLEDSSVVEHHVEAVLKTIIDKNPL